LFAVDVPDDVEVFGQQGDPALHALGAVLSARRQAVGHRQHGAREVLDAAPHAGDLVLGALHHRFAILDQTHDHAARDQQQQHDGSDE